MRQGGPRPWSSLHGAGKLQEWLLPGVRAEQAQPRTKFHRNRTQVKRRLQSLAPYSSLHKKIQEGALELRERGRRRGRPPLRGAVGQEGTLGHCPGPCVFTCHSKGLSHLARVPAPIARPGRQGGALLPRLCGVAVAEAKVTGGSGAPELPLHVSGSVEEERRPQGPPGGAPLVVPPSERPSGFPWGPSDSESSREGLASKRSKICKNRAKRPFAAAVTRIVSSRPRPGLLLGGMRADPGLRSPCSGARQVAQEKCPNRLPATESHPLTGRTWPHTPG